MLSPHDLELAVSELYDCVCIILYSSNIPSQHASTPWTRSRSSRQHQHRTVTMDTEGSVVCSGGTEGKGWTAVCVSVCVWRKRENTAVALWPLEFPAERNTNKINSGLIRTYPSPVGWSSLTNMFDLGVQHCQEILNLIILYHVLLEYCKYKQIRGR